MFSIPGRFRSLRKRWMLARFRRLLKRGKAIEPRPEDCRCPICSERVMPKLRPLQVKVHLLQVKINRLYPGALPRHRIL